MMATANEISQPTGQRRLEPALLAWLMIIAVALLCLIFKAAFPWLITFPAQWKLPIADGINVFSDTLVPLLRPIFRGRSVRQNRLEAGQGAG